MSKAKKKVKVKKGKLQAGETVYLIDDKLGFQRTLLEIKTENDIEFGVCEWYVNEMVEGNLVSVYYKGTFDLSRLTRERPLLPPLPSPVTKW